VPVFIVVGLRYGIFTPTEAGAVIVVYATVIGTFVYRALRLSAAIEILTEAALATAAVMLIISAADALGYYMTLEQIPTHAAELLTSLTKDPLVMLLVINLFLLILGMFLESLAALILVTPVLAPVGMALGIDPIHLGLVIVLNLTIGAITPPVGTLMFISCGILGVRITDYTRSILPLLGAQVVVLMLLIVFPVLVVGLPNYLMGAAH
jgi:tripartite ATP-independent transporter DctM subunit